MNTKTFTLKTEVVIPPHEQTAMADYPIEFDIYNKVVGLHILNGLKEQLEKNMSELPINKWDEFDNSTHNFHYFAEMYVVSKELIEEYMQLKENSKVQ